MEGRWKGGVRERGVQNGDKKKKVDKKKLLQ